jgi:hypothetical protein
VSSCVRRGVGLWRGVDLWRCAGRAQATPLALSSLRARPSARGYAPGGDTRNKNTRTQLSSRRSPSLHKSTTTPAAPPTFAFRRSMSSCVVFNCIAARAQGGRSRRAERRPPCECRRQAWRREHEAFTLGTESSKVVSLKGARFQATRAGNAESNSFSLFLSVQVLFKKMLPPNTDAVPQPFTACN